MYVYIYICVCVPIGTGYSLQAWGSVGWGRLRTTGFRFLVGVAL